MINSEKKILMLADDDVDDREMFCEAISSVNSNVESHCHENGKELLDNLTKLPEMPRMIFLDINMPVMNGWECLKSLKANKLYSKIPVIMYSTSSMQRDIDRALTMGASCFLVKPHDYQDLTKLLELIVDYVESDLNEVVLKLPDHQKGLLICLN